MRTVQQPMEVATIERWQRELGAIKANHERSVRAIVGGHWMRTAVVAIVLVAPLVLPVLAWKFA